MAVGRGGRRPRPRHHRGAQRLGAARVRERARGLQRLLPRHPRLHGEVGASDGRPSRGIYHESREGRTRLRRLRRGQPLLRGDRRLHPPPRPPARPALRAVGRDQRAPVPRGRRAGEPRRREPDLRPDREGRRDARLLPRQPERAEPARVPPRPRAHPARVPRPRRPPRRDGRAGAREDLDVPDARRALRGDAQARHRSRHPHLHRVQPLARRRLGLQLPRPHLRRAVHLAGRRRLGRSRSSSGRSTATRASSSCARPRPRTATGQLPPTDPAFDPFWARANEAGITVVVHAGDSGYSSAGLRARTSSSPPGSRAEVGSRRCARSSSSAPRTTSSSRSSFGKLFERFPNLRIASVENGSEFLARPVQEAQVDRAQDAGLLQGRPRRDRSASTCGSTRSGRTTRTRSSTSWAPIG